MINRAEVIGQIPFPIIGDLFACSGRHLIIPNLLAMATERIGGKIFVMAGMPITPADVSGADTRLDEIFVLVYASAGEDHFHISDTLRGASCVSGALVRPPTRWIPPERSFISQWRRSIRRNLHYEWRMAIIWQSCAGAVPDVVAAIFRPSPASIQLNGDGRSREISCRESILPK